MSDRKPGARMGVYVCHCGGNISDVIDVGGVSKAALAVEGVAIARDFPFMCSEGGQALIAQDIAELGLDRVIVSACSPSLHEGTFRKVLSRAGLNPFLYEHANIREQGSWVSQRCPAATQKAITLVHAAIGKARLLEPLEPVRIEARPRVLVIGAGVAGLRASLDLARAGLEVVLIEKQDQAGGFLRGLGHIYPDGRSAQDALRVLLERVAASPKIRLLTRTEVLRSRGSVGAFDVTLRVRDQDGVESEQEEAVGSVILATGFRSYAPAKGEYGFAKNKAVITLPDLLERLERDPGTGAFEIDGRPVRSVGFIHCVGSRQIEGVQTPPKGGRLQTHCSRVCCTAILQAAITLEERHPGLRIHSFYQDIRTYGRGHEDLYVRASRQGVIFHRYLGEHPPVISKPPTERGAVCVSVKDQLTWGEEVTVDLDLLVLGTGMTAGDTAALVDVFKLAVSEDGFLQEVHPKLRPVEPAVAGLFLAGACQSPKDVGEATASAGAAAVKAAALLGRGFVEMDPFVAHVDPSRCTGSGACLAACAYEGAIQLNKAGQAQVNPALCVGCGACVAVCPSRAISVAGWTLEQFDAMVDAIVADREDS